MDAEAKRPWMGLQRPPEGDTLPAVAGSWHITQPSKGKPRHKSKDCSKNIHPNQGVSSHDRSLSI